MTIFIIFFSFILIINSVFSSKFFSNKNSYGRNSTVLTNVPVILDLRKSLNFGELKITEGKSLTISCLSAEKITFLYPKFVGNDVANLQEEITESSADGINSVIFERRHAAYTDSGWYGCATLPQGFPKLYENQFPYTPDLFNSSNAQWVYVFVDSSNHFFVDIPFVAKDNGRFHLVEKVGNDVVLPCRSTLPKYNFSLRSKSTKLVRKKNISYDPKSEFIIKNISDQDLLSYTCQITNSSGSTQERHFDITLKHYPEFRDVPVISTEGLTHMEVGKNFSMRCEICIYQPYRYSFGWQTPQPTTKTSQKLIHLNISKHSTVKNWDSDVCETQIIELTIIDVTPEDFGQYICELYRYPVLKSAKVDLKPHTRKYLKLAMEPENGKYLVRNSESYTWNLEVNSYPLPVEFKWIGPEGSEIANSWSFKDYQINSEHFFVELRKWNINWHDNGSHVLFASNSKNISAITFDVCVEGVPEIVNYVPNEVGEYFRNEIVVFDCIARGNPRPNITWRHGEDFLTSEKISMDSVYSENVEKPGKTPEVSSSTHLKIVGHELVFCEACNNYGCDWKVINSVCVKYDSQCCSNNETST